MTETGSAQSRDLLHDTFKGLMAFVVPGPDAYSIQQGVTTTDAGGVDSGVIDALIATIDQSMPFVPQFSGTIAALLNGLAQTVNADAGGSLISPFARLTFAEKAVVFQIMDGNDSYKVLAGVLPAFVAFFVYSEAGVFDPGTRSLAAPAPAVPNSLPPPGTPSRVTPLGWMLSNYSGVADGRNEFRGYLRED